MRISDWSSDVCSSDLPPEEGFWIGPSITVGAGDYLPRDRSQRQARNECLAASSGPPSASSAINSAASADGRRCEGADRSEEHTTELQSLMRRSYTVSCLKKKKNL